MSKTGREVVVAILGAGDFFGEGCLAGQSVRRGTAAAITPSTVMIIDKSRMLTLLRRQRDMASRFIAHLLSRQARTEQDLIDQLLNSSERRLARALLLLARYGKQDEPDRSVLPISQETLAEMIGTTRSHVNKFMTKFKKLGFIDYTKNGKDGIQINSSLLSVVLRD